MDSAAIHHDVTPYSIVVNDDRAWRGKPLYEGFATTQTLHETSGAELGREIRIDDPLAPTMLATLHSGRQESAPTELLSGGRRPGSADAVVSLSAYTASDRMKLLARKYADQNPEPELLARLEILNARIGNILPRVDDVVKDALSADALRLEGFRDRFDALSRDI